MMELERSLTYFNGHNAFMLHSGISVVSLDETAATAELHVQPFHLNLTGQLHGGLLFTLADVASGVLAQADGRKYVTSSADIHYLRNVGQGVVRANSRLVRRGKRECVVQVEISDGEGRLLATATTQFLCVDETPHWKTDEK